jgi:tetrahydrodipicolinate N-succinyltransferase
MSLSALESTVNAAFDARDGVSTSTKGEVREAVDSALELLDKGEARVAERGADGKWKVNQWLKKAVLLSFRLNDMSAIPGGPGKASWWDKVPSKFEGWGENRFRDAGFRAVPGAIVRRSAFIARNVVLMPSFGVIVRKGAVLSMGVFLSASTKIVDRETGEIFVGEVPEYSVVVPGALPGKPMKNGQPGPSTACAVIVKRVDERTRAKTSINELLRD